jgi:antitoxin component YwqK of YwqJK toxin-antitoxin module
MQKEMFENNIKKEYRSDGALFREFQVNSKGQRYGWSKFYYSNGKISVERTLKNGLLDGVYKYYYLNGNVGIECTYKNGLMDGIYKLYWPNRSVHVMRKFKKGNIHGIDIHIQIKKFQNICNLIFLFTFILVYLQKKSLTRCLRSN